jgi:hypothetical protein
MQNCEHLGWYGALVILIAGGLIVVPYWRGKAELLSAWNILLGGVAIFVGIGSIEAATSPMRFKGVEWFEPTRAEVNTWLAATTVFLVTLLVSYYYDPVSRSLSARCFNKWPPISTEVFLFVIIVCMAVAIAGRVPFLSRITFIGQIAVNTSHKGMVFACLFSFILWYRNRLNLAALCLFVVILLATGFLAMLASGGRRLVLSIFLAPILGFYFYHARHWRPAKSMGIIAVAMVGLFCLSLIYSTIRHFDRRGEMAGQPRERSAARAFEAVKGIGGIGWLEHFRNDALWSLSQHTVHYGMLTDRFVSMGRLDATPFNTFKFMLVYPIPRRIWPDKPQSLGRIITHQGLGRKTTWGTGVAGHAAFEGGLIIAVMFGYLAAFGVRFFDDPLRRQPSNPFLIAMLAAAAMHIVAWPRGDLAVMTFEVAECFFFTIGLAICGRFLFGTDRPQLAGRMVVPRSRAVYQAPAR